MANHDASVAQLLRRATDDLHPDVAGIVVGAVARGRARQRRQRLGTVLASAAVVVIVGAGAVAVPVLSGGADDRSGSLVATDPTTLTPSTTSQAEDADSLAVPAADIPGVVAALTHGHDVGAALTEPPYALVDGAKERVAHFRIDGMLTTVIITRASQSLAYDCTDEATIRCRTLDNGTIVQVTPPSTADGVTMREALAIGEAWMVSVMSYNAPHGKEAEPLQPEPALTEDELVAVAASDEWFG